MQGIHHRLYTAATSPLPSVTNTTFLFFTHLRIMQQQHTHTADNLITSTAAPFATDWGLVLHDNIWSTSPLLWWYLAGGIVVLAVLWWLCRRLRPTWRAVWRAGAATFIFSPAILACGYIAIMPLPTLLLRAWRNPASASCGAPLVALPPNLMTFAGLWLVGFLALWAWQWMRHPSATAHS